MESSTSSNRPFEDRNQVLLDLNVALKDPDLMSDETSKGDFRKVEPEWLEKFIGKTFFNQCSDHSVWRNERNKYCIDCDASICHFCVTKGPHKGHELLKLYRYSSKDVTPLNAIALLFDCSQIQPYRCNKQQVLALKPLPYMGPKNFAIKELCQICQRKLINSNVYSYCSISCKLEAFTKKEDDDFPPFLTLRPEQAKTAIDQPRQNAEQETKLNELTANERANPAQKWPKTKLEELAEAASQVLENSTRKRKRKGTPHRSPFY